MKRTALLAAALSLSLVAIPSPAEPPPHAKAHGWRKKNDPTYVGYTGKKWPRDYGVVEGRCIAAAVEPEERRMAVILGAVVGHAIGKQMDSADRACMGHALELAGERRTVVWTNAASGVTYRLTPTGSFKDGSGACRRFTTVLAVGKKKETVKGAACRQPGGDWVFRA